MRAIILQLSYLVIGLSFLMVLPAVVALAGADQQSAGAFFAGAALGLVTAGLLAMALRGLTRAPDRNMMLCFAVLVWPVLAVFGAVPLLLSGHSSFQFGLFEALSGVTTTGLTIFDSVDKLPPAVRIWRSLLQWYGGLVTLAVMILILSPLTIGGHQGRGVSIGAFAGSGETLFGAAAFRRLALVYVVAMLACFAWLLASGTSAIDAFCLALSTLSTGGFVPRDGPLDAYVAPIGQICLIVFMIIGATSIVWHDMIRRLDWEQLARHRESYVVAGAALVLGLVMAAAYDRASGVAPVWQSLREGVFAATSLVSTTGYHVRPESYSVLPLSAVLAVVLVGGGSLSTAGGIKLFRCGVLATFSSRQLAQSLFPNSITSAWIGSRHWDRSEIQAVHTMTLGLFLVLAAGMLIVALSGLPFTESTVAAVAAATNAGPIYSEGPDPASPWLPVSKMSPLAQLALGGAMVAGRVEVLALFSILNFAYWRQR